jgi:hypothetical protein
MIPTYFNSPEKDAALRAAVASVVGTPFFANSEAPGRDGGMDCVHVLDYVYRTCGVIGKIEIPRQSMDWGQNSEHSLLIEAFETWPELVAHFTKLESYSVSELLPGDALCFTCGKVPHHGGLMLWSKEILHTLKSDGAHTMRIDAVIRGQKILGKLAAVYRPQPL